MSCTEGVAKPGTRDVANTDKCTDDRVDVTDGNIKGGETKERKRRARPRGASVSPKERGVKVA